jgi:hypothetical protein
MTNFTAVQTSSGTLTGGVATAITFGSPTTSGIPIRYSYLSVSNTGATVLYARADGVAAVAGADFNYAVQPGASITIANGLPLWTQTDNVLAAGTVTGAQNTGTPPEIQPYGSSLWGQKISPGTSVSLISSGTPTYTVTGMG